jgi:molybdate transport system ATP-binding protein
MIEVDVALQRGHFLLDVQLQSDADVIGLFGPSGSGKSTLLLILAGLIKPDRGYFRLNGKTLLDISQGIHVPAYRRKVGVVFQESRLFPHLSVRQNLLYGFDLIPKQARRFSLDQVVALLELQSVLDYQPDQLSGGQRQRVALGRALLASPSLLLMDEPLAALDVRLKSQILPFLRRVRDEIDIPIVYVSHAINEILYLTRQLAVIEHGQVLASGDFHTVMHDPLVLALAASLGIENTLQGQVLESIPEAGYSVVACGTQYIHVPLIVSAREGEEVTLSVSATHIALASNRLHGLTIQNQLSGRIVSIERVEYRVIVAVDIGHDTILSSEVSFKSLQALGLEVGQDVFCLIKTQSIRCDALVG